MQVPEPFWSKFEERKLIPEGEPEPPLPMSSHTRTSRTVAFKTIGCRLNQAETAQIAAQFEAAGYRIVDAKQPCDVAVVNTCTITHGAERDCARWARRLRREGARRVVLAGCAVVHDGDARLAQAEAVDSTGD